MAIATSLVDERYHRCNCCNRRHLTGAMRLAAAFRDRFARFATCKNKENIR